MNCKICGDSGKITLLTSIVECTECKTPSDKEIKEIKSVADLEAVGGLKIGMVLKYLASSNEYEIIDKATNNGVLVRRIRGRWPDLVRPSLRSRFSCPGILKILAEGRLTIRYVPNSK